MTNPTDTRALQALADKVEAGEFDRKGGGAPKYNSICNEIEASSGHRLNILAVAKMYQLGTLSSYLRTLIAGGRE